MHWGNMLTSCRELKKTGSPLTLLIKCNKGISDFIESFTFFDVFKGTYATCMKYVKYMKMCFEMKLIFVSMILEISSPYEHVLAVLLGKSKT